MVLVPGIRSDYNLIGLKESKCMDSSLTAEHDKVKKVVPVLAEKEVATIS